MARSVQLLFAMAVVLFTSAHPSPAFAQSSKVDATAADTDLTQSDAPGERLVPVSRPRDNWHTWVQRSQANTDSTAAIVPLQRQQQMMVVWRDKQGPPFNDVIGPVGSPDGQQITYIGRRSRAWMLFLSSGGMLPTLEPATTPIFSPDSNRVAFWGRDNDRPRVVVDGEPQSTFLKGRLDSLRFSPDSMRLAYVAMRQDGWRVVVDQSEGPAFDAIAGPPVWSSQGDRLAYVARYAGRWRLIAGGAMGPAYDEIASAPVFSPDANFVATWARQAGQPWVLSVNGREHPAYRGDDVGVLMFSPDGKQLAASYRQGDQWLLRVNDSVGPPGDAIAAGSAKFSPDSRRIAYALRQQGRWHVVVDHRLMERQDAILPASLKFSPNSRRLVYAAQYDGAWRVVIDGRPQTEFETLDANLITFSPDSRRLAYAGKARGQWYVVVDKQFFGPYEAVQSLTFSPNARRAAWLAQVDRQWRLVVDGQTSDHAMHGVIDGAAAQFNGNDQVHTLGFQRPGPLIYRLEWQLEPHDAAAWVTPSSAP